MQSPSPQARVLIGGVVSGMMCAKGLAAGSGRPLIGGKPSGRPRVNAAHDRWYRVSIFDVAGQWRALPIFGECCPKPNFAALVAPLMMPRARRLIKPPSCWDWVIQGGHWLEQAAVSGDETRFKFPRPLLDRPDCDLSFSGLKNRIAPRARFVDCRSGAGLPFKIAMIYAPVFNWPSRDTLAEKTRRGDYRISRYCRWQHISRGGVVLPPIR